jgi:ribonuclease P protein subunit RPR2
VSAVKYKGKHNQGKNLVKQIALERIYRLFELAGDAFGKHPERSKRYIELAQKMSSRNKVSLPQELKKAFCKKCGAYLKAGRNAKLRVKGKLLKVTCSDCNTTKKIGLVE